MAWPARAITANTSVIPSAVPVTKETAYRGVFEGGAEAHTGLFCQANPVNGIDPSGHDGELLSVMLAVSIAIIASPDIANAPGPNDATESSCGAADMCINIVGGHLIGKAIGFGVGLAKVGFSKAVSYSINAKGPLLTVDPAIPSELPPSVVASFRSRLYFRMTTTEDMIAYRAEGGTSGTFGRFYGTVKPVNALDAEELGNVIKWDNECTTLSTYRIPKGSVIYKGGVEGGAGEQIYIPNPTGSGVKLISSEPLPLKVLRSSDFPGESWD